MARNQTIYGSCLCGRITFSVEGPFQIFYLCHCKRCQKISGSSGAANLFAGPKSVNWLSGQNVIQSFALSEATYFNAAFCKACGSSVPRRAKSGNFMIIPAGCLDDDPGMKLEKIIFWKDRPIWHDPDVFIPVHHGYGE